MLQIDCELRDSLTRREVTRVRSRGTFRFQFALTRLKGGGHGLKLPATSYRYPVFAYVSVGKQSWEREKGKLWPPTSFKTRKAV
jgi:hypothetical protein